MYLFINSEDSLTIYPNNTGDNFTVELPKPIQLESEDWRVAVTEIKSDKGNGYYIICCDIVEESYIKDKYLPVLRAGGQTSFTNPYYLKIRTNYIPRIHFQVYNKNLKPVGWKSVKLTLHLQKWPKETEKPTGNTF